VQAADVRPSVRRSVGPVPSVRLLKHRRSAMSGLRVRPRARPALIRVAITSLIQLAIYSPTVTTAAAAAAAVQGDDVDDDSAAMRYLHTAPASSIQHSSLAYRHNSFPTLRRQSDG